MDGWKIDIQKRQGNIDNISIGMRFSVPGIIPIHRLSGSCFSLNFYFRFIVLNGL